MQLREEFIAIARDSSLEDAVDGMKQFAGDGDESLQFGFVPNLKSFVKNL